MTTSGWRLVWALAAAQLVSWGAIYYSFSLFVLPMESELGWSRAAIEGAFSLGLLVSGLAAYPVGAWIDRGGGRAVMSLGSGLAVALLAVWAWVGELGAFYAILAGLGVALAATLYEPVFAVLTRRFPGDYRTRITALTLVGGFASTVFIPFTGWAIDSVGWRPTLLLLAAANLLVCLPIHALLLGRESAAPGRAPRAFFDDALRAALRRPEFWGLALCFTAYYATYSALTFHIVPLLEERHVPTALALGAIAAIGPAQVAGRVVLLAARQHASAALSGRWALVVYPASVALLIAFPASLAALFGFALLSGAANGILTVVRGTIVPELLGLESYGAINGALTLPATLARAAGPYGAAVIWDIGGYSAVLAAIVAGGVIAAAGFWLAARQAGNAVAVAR